MSWRTYARVLAAVATALALALMLLTTAFAQPATSDCTTSGSGCNSYQWWNGGTSGVQLEYQISNPPLQNNLSFYSRGVSINDADSGGLANVQVGITKTKGSIPAQCNNDNLLYYYMFADDDNGNPEGLKCFTVPTSDINQFVEFQIGPYYSNGGGELVRIFSRGGTINDFIPNVPQAYGRITYQEQIYDKPINGHYEWGVQWLNNSYESNNTYYHQARPPDNLTQTKPVLMYWSPNPAPGNNGGIMYSCIYDNSNGPCVVGG